MIISHASYWPGITYDVAMDLPYHVWAALALTCDMQVDREKQQRREAEARSR